MSSGDGKTTLREGDQEDEDELDLYPNACLHVVYGPDSGLAERRIEMAPGPDALLIGRDVSEGVSLPDPRLSRLHLRIVWDAGRRAFRLGDCDSSNGTYVNGLLVRSQVLVSNDVIRCGDSLLVFEVEHRQQVLLERARRFASGMLSALIQGETGVGKEVMARMIHEQSGRSGEFVAVNCAALSRDLAATELFGHTRGAFTGATGSRAGLFVSAHRGTLLLDEIGDLPLEVQPTLLRVLQERAVRAVGSDQLRRVDVRVLAATHIDLFAAAEQGLFRKDLLARLAQVRLELPSLRERRSEVLRLMRRFATEAGYSLELSANAAEALLLWHFPFNVRELQSIAGSLATELRNGRVDLVALRHVDRQLAARGSFHSPKQPTPAQRDVGERRLQLQEVLRRHRGNVTHVAKELGRNRSQVYRLMKSLGLSARRFRDNED